SQRYRVAQSLGVGDEVEVDGGAGRGVVLAHRVGTGRHEEMVEGVQHDPTAKLIARDERGVDGGAGGGVVLAERVGAAAAADYEQVVGAVQRHPVRECKPLDEVRVDGGAGGGVE